MTTLIIARHGNTFGPNDIVTYVGARTDLPLVESGREQAKAIGQYLKQNHLIPDIVYCSHLKRTQETAKIAIKESGYTNPIYPLDIFNEIDYGPDENKPREEVLARIGEKALKNWETHNIVPPGWNINPENVISNWKNFTASITTKNEITLVVTSNGIARFSPHITGNYAEFHDKHAPKLATGALAIFNYENTSWEVSAWNLNPAK